MRFNENANLDTSSIDDLRGSGGGGGVGGRVAMGGGGLGIVGILIFFLLQALGGGGGTGGTGGPTTNHPPVSQPEFDVDVPQGERSATIPISQLVQDEDGDDLSFVDASLQDPAHGELTIGSVTVPARGTAGPSCAPPAAAGGLVSLRVGDADRACHCAISSVANAAEVSMRSAV